MYEQGVTYDLNDYLADSGAGWTIDYATGINDFGQIAVYGRRQGSSSLVGAILTPCSSFPGGGATQGCFPGPGPFPAPEPATLALVAVSLAGLGATRRRKPAATTA